MDGIVAAWAAALALGATHALEVDHMVAVNAFIGNRPRLSAAVSFGVRWALGHAAVVLAAGMILVSLGITVPEGFLRWAETGVGLMLVALGVWAARTATRLHLHLPASHEGHAHLHSHDPKTHPHNHAHASPQRRHRHLPTAVGAAHGLAGVAPVVALIPVTLDFGFWGSVVYLIAFGIGTTVAMGIYAGLAAVAVARLGSSVRSAVVVAGVTAGASILTGLWWLARGVVG